MSSNLTISSAEYNDILSQAEKLAIKATETFDDFKAEYSRWSLEQAMTNRAELSAKKAADNWLKSFLSNGLLEDNKGVKKALINLKSEAVKEDRATANIIMRLTPEQKNKMVANAQKDGKSLTQFVLSRCL